MPAMYCRRALPLLSIALQWCGVILGATSCYDGSCYPGCDGRYLYYPHRAHTHAPHTHHSPPLSPSPCGTCLMSAPPPANIELADGGMVVWILFGLSVALSFAWGLEVILRNRCRCNMPRCQAHLRRPIRVTQRLEIKNARAPPQASGKQTGSKRAGSLFWMLLMLAHTRPMLCASWPATKACSRSPNAAAPAKCGIEGRPKLLVVISSWRTGSNLLSQMLGSHPDVDFTPVPEWFRREERAFDDLGWPSSMRAAWQQRFGAPARYVNAAISIKRQSSTRAVTGHKFQLGWLVPPREKSSRYVRLSDFDRLFVRNASWCNTPETERVQPLQPTKLGNFLRSNVSGVDAVHALVREPSHVLAWSNRARGLAATSTGDQPSDRVRTLARTLAHICMFLCFLSQHSC